MAAVTVTDLMMNFARACRALVPAMEHAGVRWRDGEQYDNWDRIATGLFESLVTEPRAFQAVGEAGLAKLRIAPYGFAPEATCNAWLAVQEDRSARVITLTSPTTPFAHVQCEEPTGLVPLEGSSFVFVYDVGDGAQLLERVDLAAK